MFKCKKFGKGLVHEGRNKMAQGLESLWMDAASEMYEVADVVDMQVGEITLEVKETVTSETDYADYAFRQVEK
jgi:hypothetical protein